jgi:hypothetical protein
MQNEKSTQASEQALLPDAQTSVSPACKTKENETNKRKVI